jgi:cell division protein FtsI (penicillin-binding protein 3)
MVVRKDHRKNIILRLEEDIDEPKIELSLSAIKRIRFILILIIISFLTVVFKMISVATSTNDSSTISLKIDKVRGKIYDRNGSILAVNLPTKSIYVRPDEVFDVENTAKALVEVIDEKNDKLYEIFLSKLKSPKPFVWIKRHILPSQQLKIRSLGLQGVYLADDSKRFYPQENDFSHLIGFVDIDQNGISGVEKSFNEVLSEGNDIELSLDINIQSIVRNKLSNSILNHEALGGMAVIMDVNNGEIVSLVSLPDFNPNGQKLTSNKDEEMFNRATLGLYEMGSTFKILTLAIGLDMGAVKLSDSFNVSQPIKLGKYLIKDYKFHKANLTLPEVLIFSSNRGVGQVGIKIGIEKQQEYLRNIGMLSPIDLEIGERGRPLHVSPKQWNEVYLVTISYGHGIAVTALHTVQAIASVTNGGILYKPTILKQTLQPEGVRVFKEKTSHTMRKLMRRVVEEGYAKKAEVEGYNIGGKTGTAEKVKNGKYVKHNCNLASFFGAFPIDNPQYVIFVAVDEPKPNKLNQGFTTGGWVAAPLAADILREVGYLLGTKTNQQKVVYIN